MATIALEFTAKGIGGGRSVSIRVTSKREHKRIPTGVKLEACDYREYPDGRIKITNNDKYFRVMDLMSEINKKIQVIEDMNPLMRIGAKQLCELALKRGASNPGTYNFFAYAEDWLKNANIKGENNYKCMLNNLERYHGSRFLPFAMIDVSFLKGFEAFLQGRPSAREHYLSHIRHIYKQAAMEYNTDNEFYLSPTLFERYKVPKHASMGQRALSIDELSRFIAYTPKNKYEELAKDCCILSLCTMGTNSVDLYNMVEYDGEKICYERTKTKDRRKDRARIEITVDSIIRPLIDKYRGEERVFCFYKMHNNANSFNRIINMRLRRIGACIGIEKLQFYRFRHSWATIARNECGIDRGTVDEGLNHVSGSGILDIYVKKDYRLINEANRKVIDFVFGRNQYKG